MYVYRYKHIYLYVCNIFTYIYIYTHIYLTYDIYIYTYFTYYIMIYDVILCYIVLDIFNWFHIVIYAPLARLRPESLRVDPNGFDHFLWGERVKISKPGTHNFKKEEVILRLNTILNYFHMSMMFHWYWSDPFLRNPLFVRPVGHFPASERASPPQVHGVSLESLDIAMNRIDFRGALVTWWKMSLATGLYRQIWVREPSVFRCFLECSTVFIAIKGGLKSQKCPTMIYAYLCSYME